MNKERLEEMDRVVDDLLNNRGELTNFVNDYYLQAERFEVLAEQNDEVLAKNRRYQAFINKATERIKGDKEYGQLHYDVESILSQALDGELDE